MAAGTRQGLPGGPAVRRVPDLAAWAPAASSDPSAAAEGQPLPPDWMLHCGIGSRAAGPGRAGDASAAGSAGPVAAGTRV